MTLQENENDVEVLVRPNGPYRVSGRFRLVDIDGNEFPLPEGWDADRPIALCRCGHSAIKPFCDSAHKRTGFTPETRAVPPSA